MAAPNMSNRDYHLDPHATESDRRYRFPPHPSVRIQYDNRASPREPQIHSGRRNPCHHPQPQYRHYPTGPPIAENVVQGFHFPRAPPVHRPAKRLHYERPIRMPHGTPSHPRQRYHQDPFGRQTGQERYSMHKSHMSSIHDEPSPDSTPLPPGSMFPSGERYSASVYTQDEVQQINGPNPVVRQVQDTAEEGAEHTAEPGDSQVSEIEEIRGEKSVRPNDDDTVGIAPKMHLSPAAQARPAPLKIDVARDIPIGVGQVPTTPRTREAQISALKIAVEASLRNQPQPTDHVGETQDTSTVRMPFTDSPPISPVTPNLPPPQLREFCPDETEDVSQLKTNHIPSTGSSETSHTALLEKVQNEGVARDNRARLSTASRLDGDQARSAENRASTSSLSELIRRATKLASNLEKGKTASRLGLNDFLSSAAKGGNGQADGTYWGFPAPGTHPAHRDSKSAFEDLDKVQSDDEKDNRPDATRRGRRCCGLTVPVLLLLLLTIIIVVAAAVLIPIFLVVIPNQRTGQINLDYCAKQFPCSNGGKTVIVNSQCGCVCSGGFTGSQCGTPSTVNCTTLSFTTDSVDYKDATVGLSVLPVFSSAQSEFNIKLNTSRILALFAAGNASCLNENTLVDFNTSSLLSRPVLRRRSGFMRLYRPGVDTPLNPSLRISSNQVPDSNHIEIKRTAGSVSTANGIVYAASSDSTPSSVTTPPSVSTVVNIEPLSTASSSRAVVLGVVPSTNTTNNQVDFAKVVVLYVLDQSGVLSVAVNARQRMMSYLVSPNTTDSTHTGTEVEVGFGDLKLTADFGTFSITKGDGSKVGELRS